MYNYELMIIVLRTKAFSMFWTSLISSLLELHTGVDISGWVSSVVTLTMKQQKLIYESIKMTKLPSKSEAVC